MQCLHCSKTCGGAEAKHGSQQMGYQTQLPTWPASKTTEACIGLTALSDRLTVLKGDTKVVCGRLLL